MATIQSTCNYSAIHMHMCLFYVLFNKKYLYKDYKLCSIVRHNDVNRKYPILKALLNMLIISQLFQLFNHINKKVKPIFW